MENHPIPQDVTGFQFRLIGSMTIKQFAYVGAGGILAVVTFYLPIHGLIKLLLVPLFGGIGALFAFVPIEGRPMDVMAGNFFKALFTPNQYLYHKIGRAFATTTPQPKPAAQPTTPQETQQPATKEERLTSYLSNIEQDDSSSIDQKESAYLQKLFTAHMQPAQTTLVNTTQLPASQPTLPTPTISATPPTATPSVANVPPNPSPTANTAPQFTPPATAQQEVIPQNSTQLPTVSEPIPSPVTPAQDSGMSEHEKKLADILAEKKRLEEELAKIRNQTSQNIVPAQQQIPSQPPSDTASAAKELLTPPIYKTKAPAATNTLPDIPNLLMGTVRDSRGNVLPNILIEVRDTEGNPVRAFKTNVLGQFASATALTNGSYTVSFEDPKGQHQFSDVSIVASGAVIEPLQVASIDAREELRKALFA